MPNVPFPCSVKPEPARADLVAQALTYEWSTILDIGAGYGWIAETFLRAGRKPVTAASQVQHPDIPDLGAVPMDDMAAVADASFDAVWASHVLEHVSNTGRALDEVRRILKPRGWLFLIVPPFKHSVVDGHVNVGWNIGILAYVLALHGFDARNGAYVRHGYNVAAFVQKSDTPPLQGFMVPRLEEIAERLPVSITHRSNGFLKALNWTWRVPLQHRPKWRSKVKWAVAPLLVRWFI